jgi:FMN phosphatase YigB (HAD superfamily)
MQLKNKYKVIFIDWNGTLSISKFWGHLEKGSPEEQKLFNNLETALFKENRDLILPWMRGKVDTNYVIDKISNTSSIDSNRILYEFIKSCESMKLISEKIPELISSLQKQKIKIVLATDNMDSFQKWTIPSLSLNTMFDDILDSYSLKAMKGDFSDEGNSLFFNEFLTKDSIKPDETIIIDDSEDKNNKIEKYGIDYYKIEPAIGLVPALKHILITLH